MESTERHSPVATADTVPAPWGLTAREPVATIEAPVAAPVDVLSTDELTGVSTEAVPLTDPAAETDAPQESWLTMRRAVGISAVMLVGAGGIAYGLISSSEHPSRTQDNPTHTHEMDATTLQALTTTTSRVTVTRASTTTAVAEPAPSSTAANRPAPAPAPKPGASAPTTRAPQPTQPNTTKPADAPRPKPTQAPEQARPPASPTTTPETPPPTPPTTEDEGVVPR